MMNTITVPHRRKAVAMIVCLTTPLLITVAAAVLVPGARELYESMAKPTLALPYPALAALWVAMCLVLAVSSYLAFSAPVLPKDLLPAGFAYGGVLLLSLVWFLMVFRQGALWYGVSLTVALVVLVLASMYTFSYLNYTGAVLLSPFLLWSLYIVYLCVQLALRNVIIAV